MELRQLRYFEAVAAECNFTRAAKRLRIAQPPLSRQIKALEEELGVTLFERDTRPVRLTEAGRVLYEQAVQILAGVQQLRQTMDRIRLVQNKRFVIGVVGSIMYGGLPVLIREFRRQTSATDVQLLEMTTLDQVEALNAGRIDAGLGRVRIDHPGVRREVLYEEPLIAAIPAADAFAGSDAPISLSELAARTLIAYPSQPRPSYIDQVLSLFRDHGGIPAEIVEVREVQMALGLVAAQSGVAVVPASMQHLQREDLAYRPLAEAEATSPIILSQRTNDDSEEALRFRTIARRVLAPDAGNPEE